MIDKEWLQNLKPGDLVLISGETRAKVVRLTKTLIILDNKLRFKKSNGREPGDHSWGWVDIQQPTQDAIDQISQRDLAEYFRQYPWKSVSLKSLRSVYSLVPKRTVP